MGRFIIFSPMLEVNRARAHSTQRGDPWYWWDTSIFLSSIHSLTNNSILYQILRYSCIRICTTLQLYLTTVWVTYICLKMNVQFVCQFLDLLLVYYQELRYIGHFDPGVQSSKGFINIAIAIKCSIYHFSLSSIYKSINDNYLIIKPPI